MRKKLTPGVVIPFMLLLSISCNKDYKSSSGENMQPMASKQVSASGCLMTSYDYYDGSADSHSIDYYTYKNGLVDNVLASYGQRFYVEYDAKNKLTGSRVYEGETLLYIITFIYEKQKIVEEIWNDATTEKIYDQVFLKYDKKGNLIRNESIIFDQITTYTYTSNQNLESWQVFIGGLPVAKAEYAYNDNYKNPFTSVSGIQYGFWVANEAFGFGTGKAWYSSEKVTLYDENGAAFIYYEQDPSKTIWQVGQQHYPLKATYINLNNQGIITTTFTYENCDGGISSEAQRFNEKMTPKNTNGVKRNRGYFKIPFKMEIEKLRKMKLS